MSQKTSKYKEKKSTAKLIICVYESPIPQSLQQLLGAVYTFIFVVTNISSVALQKVFDIAFLPEKCFSIQPAHKLIFFLTEMFEVKEHSHLPFGL